jgi:hypothetical protein
VYTLIAKKINASYFFRIFCMVIATGGDVVRSQLVIPLSLHSNQHQGGNEQKAPGSTSKSGDTHAGKRDRCKKIKNRRALWKLLIPTNQS